MKILYDAIFFVFALSYLPFFILRLKEEKNKKRLIAQRFGLFDAEVTERVKGKKVLWVHAVSVGEAFAAKTLVDALEQDLSDWQIVVSTVTPTGQAIARKLFERLPVIYYPFDLSFAVNRALDALKPKAVLLMETELWPNMIHAAHAKNIPVGIVNGRLSPKSYRRYGRIRELFKNVLEKVTFFLVQFQWDADRLSELGVEPSKIHVTGNMKFDIVQELRSSDVLALEKKYLSDRKAKVIVAGSTHEGEEKVLLAVLRKLRFEFPAVKLVIAPRHVTRGEWVAKLAVEQGFRVQRASQSEAPVEDVFVLDVMGELRKWYALADFVFTGGSLIRHGGQNPIEAAILKKPVIFGPHVFNFQLIYDKMLEEKAGCQVYNENELYDFLKKMLIEPHFAKQVGERGAQLVARFQGATQRNAEFVERFLTQHDERLLSLAHK